jgi:hypothetical protein
VSGLTYADLAMQVISPFFSTKSRRRFDREYLSRDSDVFAVVLFGSSPPRRVMSAGTGKPYPRRYKGKKIKIYKKR